METLYIKLNISKSDIETDTIREAGLLFENIADAIDLDRDSIEEIDESNFPVEIKNIENKFLK